MKNRLLFITSLFFLAFNIVNAQQISDSEKYFIYFRTWSFLKYYHPDFTTGKKNADVFFLDRIALIDKIKSKAELNQTITHIINDFAKNNTVEIPAKAKHNPEQDWYLNSKLLNTTLKKQFINIYNNRDTIGKFYVPAINYVAEIPNEKKYEFPDSLNLPVEMRLLALAKLQGAISYLYPHQSLMKQNWEKVIKDNIPLFLKCTSRKTYEILVLKIIANLNDTHAYNRFYTALKFKNEIFKNTNYPPFAYQLFKNKILVTEIIVPSLCTEAGIKIGDFITEINGQSIANRIDQLSGLLSASNRTTLIFKLNGYATNFILGSDSSKVNLKVYSNGKRKNISINFITGKDKLFIEAINNHLNTKAEKNAGIKPFQILENDIAYFNIANMRELLNSVEDNKLDDKIDSILNLAAKQKGIIFDMRGYPSWGGFIHHYIYKKFSKADNFFAKYYKADLKDLGNYSFLEAASTYYPNGVKTENFQYKGKVRILVNSATQSASEWYTMNLQYVFPKALTIGVQTAGADGDEKSINIPGNYTINFTGNAIFYPNGTPAQGKGIKIDRIVELEVADILSGKDTQLNYTIKSIR